MMSIMPNADALSVSVKNNGLTEGFTDYVFPGTSAKIYDITNSVGHLFYSSNYNSSLPDDGNEYHKYSKLFTKK